MENFKWVVEIEVDKTWVEDGFNLDDEKVTRMLNKVLPYAYSNEFSAKVISAPAAAEIRKAQGYDTYEQDKSVIV